ncbi:MAG: trigger factor [Chloroflexi bacterium]|nr:MAG: trigger factor [Chloroflexota bacterium]
MRARARATFHRHRALAQEPGRHDDRGPGRSRRRDLRPRAEPPRVAGQDRGLPPRQGAARAGRSAHRLGRPARGGRRDDGARGRAPGARRKVDRPDRQPRRRGARTGAGKTRPAESDDQRDAREPMAEITPVEREVRTGDIAVIDIEVEAGGQVVESETRKSTEAEVKEGVLLPELIAVLPGTFVGETREANVSFPESYSNPQLAGKDATIRVTVRGVKEKVLAPLDDELVKSLTSGKQETVEAYKQAVREELEESAHAVEKMDRESAVVKALVDASSVEVPEALVDRELTSELESLERSLNRQGMKLDRYFQYLGRSIDEWIAAQRPDAEARLKIDLVLAEYARREGLEPSEEDVAKFLEEQAGSDDELKGQVTELKRSPTATRYFASRLRRRRVLDQLLQVAGS